MSGTGYDDKAQQVEATLKDAEIARKKKRYNEGIALLVDALDHQVMTDAVYFRLGNIYYDAGDLSRAEYVWLRAIAVNPRHAGAHYNLAAVYKQTGRLAESVRMHKRAVRLQAFGRTRKHADRGQGETMLPLGPSADVDINLRTPVQDEPEPPESPEGDSNQEDHLKDDPRFRAWSRFLLLQGIVFAVLSILLLLILVLLAADRLL